MLTAIRQVDITNTLGLHLRAAGAFVKLAQQFRAEVWVVCDGRRASGKSILDLATLAAECGCRLELETDGPDAAAALDALTGLIARGFDEDA
jgi:phosphocarrier protein